MFHSCASKNKNYLLYPKEVINQMSMLPIQCQKESSVWGAVRGEKLLSSNCSITIPLGCGTAQLLRQLDSNADQF